VITPVYINKSIDAVLSARYVARAIQIA